MVNRMKGKHIQNMNNEKEINDIDKYIKLS